MGALRLATDPRFAALEARLRHRAELDAELSRWTCHRDRYQVAEQLQKRGIPAGPVLDCWADCQGRRENVPAGRSKTVPLNATL